MCQHHTTNEFVLRNPQSKFKSIFRFIFSFLSFWCSFFLVRMSQCSSYLLWKMFSLTVQCARTYVFNAAFLPSSLFENILSLFSPLYSTCNCSMCLSMHWLKSMMILNTHWKGKLCYQCYKISLMWNFHCLLYFTLECIWVTSCSRHFVLFFIRRGAFDWEWEKVWCSLFSAL